MDTKVLLLLLSPLLVSVMANGSPNDKRARCVMVGEEVSGNITFMQEATSQYTKVEGYVTGLSEGKHGFHIHQKGNLSRGCMAAGPHFNPYGQTHGGPTDTVRHAGDLGNIVADLNGIARVDIETTQIPLTGDDDKTIIGRTLIVHADPDDLGKVKNDPESLKTGNAGERKACCIIKLIQ